MDHSCDLVPSYLYKLNPADETDPNPQEIEKLEGEDLKPLPVEEMARLGSWVHFAPTLLKEGRVKRKELEEEDETKKEQLEKERSLEDPLEARLKPISHDQSSNRSPSGRPARLLGAQGARRPRQAAARLQAQQDRPDRRLAAVARLAGLRPLRLAGTPPSRRRCR